MGVQCFRITGIVQGVGFRPFIHKLACKYQLNGWILNDSDGVLIEVDGNQISSFIQDVQSLAPPLAIIDNIVNVPTDTPHGVHKGFEIRKSVKKVEMRTLVPPDSFVCDDCVRELFDPSDRRYKYPFINCTNCGPRYSIIKEMPYDRPKTTMHRFKMCPNCEREYSDHNDRRYHAQPVACPVCGPELEVRDNQGKIVDVEDIIAFCQEQLLQGKIFAIKSIGGFHLAVNALDDNVIKKLRIRKRRDSKPFAIMVRDTSIAERYVNLLPDEMRLLNSVQRPIVLLQKKTGTLPESLAPGNPCYGIMLPSAPLHYLLLDNEILPVLIMTSGNMSGEPIVFNNNDALKELNRVADFFLFNNRDIHVRVDDSIMRVIKQSGSEETFAFPIRRSRGYAPYPVKIGKNVRPVLALGSELKATVALSRNNEVFLSQHIGDLKNDKTFSSLKECSDHLAELLSITPEIIACDAHPRFKNTVESQRQSKLPVILVQHHHAHMASCMAENKLNSDVIGVIFDGTGYGLDGTIWGGEFLIGNYKSFKRVACLSPFFLLGGDKAVEEPYRVAIDLLYRTYGEKTNDLKLSCLNCIKEDEMKFFLKMAEKRLNAFHTTSMGRLFDGISALLNVCSKIEYEAQAAIELESLLKRDFVLAEPLEFIINKGEESFEIDYRPMIRQIVENLLSNQSNCDLPGLSRRFHSTIVRMVGDICLLIRERHGIDQVVLSGGVFMNEFLLVNTIHLLRELQFQVFYHNLVPTNDGGISLGQIMVADAMYKP